MDCASLRGSYLPFPVLPRLQAHWDSSRPKRLCMRLQYTAPFASLWVVVPRCPVPAPIFPAIMLPELKPELEATGCLAG